MSETDQRQPTEDEAMGIRLWNSLDDDARAEWARKAGNTGVAADAWAAFKSSERDHESRLPGSYYRGDDIADWDLHNCRNPRL